MINKIKSKNLGYTLIELIVAMSITGSLLTIVLANFRSGQRSAELTTSLKQVINTVKAARDMSSAGGIDQSKLPPTYPTGGYLVHFEFDNPKRLALASSYSPFVNSNATRYLLNNIIPNGKKDFTDIQFVSFCGLDKNYYKIDGTTGLPCDTTKKWKNIEFSSAGDFLDVGFNMGGEVIYNFNSYTNEDFSFIGGIFKHSGSNRNAYFYISTISGLITGNVL